MRKRTKSALILLGQHLQRQKNETERERIESIGGLMDGEEKWPFLTTPPTRGGEPN